MIATFILAALLLAAPDRQADPAADLAAARALYATAAYEDALDRLSRIGAGGSIRDKVDTYKALCLLALGRSRESEKVLEQILTRNPAFVPDENEVSPRLIEAFRGVRARLLPAAARNLYTTARAHFDEKNYELAAAEFRELIALLGSDDAEAILGDLRLLAEDFLKMAESGGSRPVQPNAAILSISRVATRGPVYSIRDREVAAPVEMSRPVPVWNAPRGTPLGLYQGLVEIVVDENGRVEYAAILRSIAPAFDAEILAATENWRFQPATKGGQPVKYRRSYEVIGHSRY